MAIGPLTNGLITISPYVQIIIISLLRKNLIYIQRDFFGIT